VIEGMADQKFTLTDNNQKQITVLVRKDKRLSKTSRWVWQKDGTILLRVPPKMSKIDIHRMVDQLAGQLEKRSQLAERRTDAELQHRAEQINRKYFGGKIQWRAIRWVENMEHRLGSCTNGGSTDGHIRISDKIKNWPDWVVDYVIAHEMVHRLHANHNAAFWETLTKGYPQSERARGFIQGVGFAEGEAFEEED
jgi:predicted metal-dependent hydrolase